jgi:hypothetical protein
VTVRGYGPANGQFGTKANLVVSTGGKGLDISQQQFRFEVRGADNETPNTAVIRVYNLSDSTAKSIIAEFDTVTLQAGFQFGNFGIIFQGTIKQFRRGRERNVDNYLDILAADGDEAYNFGVVNQSFAAGGSYSDQLTALSSAMGTTVDPNADSYVSTGGILPRGKVLFGMARLYMRNIQQNTNSRWSIQNGKVTLVPNTGYLPGDIVKLNSSSGLIGVPEQTDNGITISCLLNPLIKIGQRVQINNADINQATIKEQFFPSYTSQYYPASLSHDGIYRVLVAEHIGDTRGSDWQTELTCLNIDPSSAPSSAVLSHG